MKLLSFVRPDGQAAVGVTGPEGVVDVSAASGGDPRFAAMSALIAAGDEGLADLQAILDAAPPALGPAESLALLAPIPRPAKNVFCLGLNYESHVVMNAAALGFDPEIPEVPLFFSKPSTAVIGPGAAIRCDRELTTKLDWEIELAVVVGRGGTWISPDEAGAHIFGYTLVNDVSARDLQWRTTQMFYGKGLDTFCPMGPVIVTADEIGSLDEVVIEVAVNGHTFQSEAAGNMLFSAEDALCELSRGISLEAGDIISLGSPGGCGYQLDPPVFLEPGDVVESRCSRIGAMVNPVIEVDGSNRRVAP